jgi:hypothetical protein
VIQIVKGKRLGAERKMERKMEKRMERMMMMMNVTMKEEMTGIIKERAFSAGESGERTISVGALAGLGDAWPTILQGRRRRTITGGTPGRGRRDADLDVAGLVTASRGSFIVVSRS